MFQRTALIGRLGADPKCRYTPDGTPVTNFSVAVTEKISKKRSPSCPQGWKESYNGRHWEITTWWNITCWRGLAETMNEYLEKGQLVYVEGVVNGETENGTRRPRVWTGDDGVSRSNYELVARDVKFLGRSNGQQVEENYDF